MKAKRVGKKNANTKETEVLGEKSLCRSPNSKSIHQRISWSTRITKGPPSLVYPLYLSPPSSCYQLVSRNLVFSSFPESRNSARLHPPMIGFFQYFPVARKPHFTLRLGVVSVWAFNLSRIWIWRGRSRVFFRVFSLKNTPYNMWVMRVYVDKDLVKQT